VSICPPNCPNKERDHLLRVMRHDMLWSPKISGESVAIVPNVGLEVFRRINDCASHRPRVPVAKVQGGFLEQKYPLDLCVGLPGHPEAIFVPAEKNRNRLAESVRTRSRAAISLTSSDSSNGTVPCLPASAIARLSCNATDGVYVFCPAKCEMLCPGVAITLNFALPARAKRLTHNMLSLVYEIEMSRLGSL
jgi:hypothetical protein